MRENKLEEAEKLNEQILRLADSKGLHALMCGKGWAPCPGDPGKATVFSGITSCGHVPEDKKGISSGALFLFKQIFCESNDLIN